MVEIRVKIGILRIDMVTDVVLPIFGLWVAHPHSSSDYNYSIITNSSDTDMQ